jgi:hypothetical protein
MRCLLERLLFPKYVYGGESLANTKPTAFIFDMNVTEEISTQNYQKLYDDMEDFLEYTFKVKPYLLKVYDTYQFKDYSLYQHNFDEQSKRKQLEEQFPKDLLEAYNLGIRIVQDAVEKKK